MRPKKYSNEPGVIANINQYNNNKFLTKPNKPTKLPIMIAHAGVILATRAAMPRLKPFEPSVCQINRAIFIAPNDSPVCRRVFNTSTGCYLYVKSKYQIKIKIKIIKTLFLSHTKNVQLLLLLLNQILRQLRNAPTTV